MWGFLSMRIARQITLLLTLIISCTARAEPEDILERLRVDHAALVATESDFRLRRDRGTLYGVEATDYAAYVARLQRRVIEDCVALAQADILLPKDLPCPNEMPVPARSASIDQGAEQTRGDQLAVLDAELNASLGEFDELLLREQEQVKAATPRSDDSAGGQGEGEGNGEGKYGPDGSLTGEAGGGGDGVGSGDQSPANAQGGAGRGGGNQASSTGRPADIPDGSDDDVVARQLREAAEQETDPVLKKKLWEEYRKYKKGIR